MENTGFERAWGPASLAPYLSRTLRQQGLLLTNYYAVAPSSLSNYIAQISGQGPNPKTLNNCAIYHPFVLLGTGPLGQAVGQGCIYPASVLTIADQLSAVRLSWKGYMEDMESPCRHPEAGAADATKKVTLGDEYVTRHNPFVYFAGITGSADCVRNVVDLSEFKGDVKAIATTPNLSYITPDVCDDAHDTPCVDGSAGGLATAETWLKEWVPVITSSPAFEKDGMLVVTFDEGDNERTSTGTIVVDPGAPLPAIFGPGGGKVGALILSPLVSPGASSDSLYNHYSLLASIEDIFGLPYLGYAAARACNGSDPMFTMREASKPGTAQRQTAHLRHCSPPSGPPAGGLPVSVRRRPAGFRRRRPGSVLACANGNPRQKL